MKISQIINNEMKNPEFSKEYLSAKERSASTLAMYNVREHAALTQADLTERTGITQSSIF